MTKAAEFYKRAALCHEKAAICSKESEKKGWFDLACIWLRLADSVSARTEFGPAKEPLELTDDEMIRPTAADPIVPTQLVAGQCAIEHLMRAPAPRHASH